VLLQTNQQLKLRGAMLSANRYKLAQSGTSIPLVQSPKINTSDLYRSHL